MIDMEEATVEIVNGDLIDIRSGEVLLSRTEIEKTADTKLDFVETSDNKLAIGVSFPSTMQIPADYLKDIDEYRFTTSDIYKQMDVCDRLYKYEGIVGSVIDMMVDMANTPIISQDLKNSAAKKLFSHFSKSLNKKVQTTTTGLISFIDQGMSQWLIFGNAFPYKSWRKVEVDGKQYELPNITYLNPQAIHIDEDRLMMGEEKIYLKLNNRSFSKLRKSTPEGAGLLKGLSTKDKRNGKIPLKSEQITHIKRKPRDWEGWGIPYLTRAFSPISSKKRLRRLDDTTTEGLINYLTIFKLGSTDAKSPYHKVSIARLNAFANLIKNPTASTSLIWAHDISVETAGPDGKVLDFKDKYGEVDADILKSLGIAPGILDQTRRIDDGAILILVETLETVRNNFLTYIKETYDEVLERNKIKVDEYTLTFANIKLSDILQKLKSLILSFYDRGLLSYETALTLGGHDFIQETKRKKSEQSIREEGLFEVPNLPFSTNKTEEPMTKRDDGRPEEKIRTEKTKIDNDVKTDKPEKEIGTNVSKADSFYIDAYKQGLDNKYQKMIDKLVDAMSEADVFDENMFDLIVSAGFIEIKNYARKALKIVYDVFNEDIEVDEHDLMFQRLEGWNTTYLDKFKNTVMGRVKKGTTILDGMDVDLLIPLVVTTFEKEKYRFGLYASEGFIKARVAGTIEIETRSGNIGGFWETAGDDRVCAACAAMSGNWYKSADIFDISPVHPLCRCGISWTDHNPLISEPETNNTIVVTNPANPNKLL